MHAELPRFQSFTTAFVRLSLITTHLSGHPPCVQTAPAAGPWLWPCARTARHTRWEVLAEQRGGDRIQRWDHVEPWPCARAVSQMGQKRVLARERVGAQGEICGQGDVG